MGKQTETKPAFTIPFFTDGPTKWAEKVSEKELAEQISTLKTLVDDLTTDLKELNEVALANYCKDQSKTTKSKFFVFTPKKMIVLDDVKTKAYYMKNKALRGFFKITVPLSKAENLDGFDYEVKTSKPSVKPQNLGG